MDNDTHTHHPTHHIHTNTLLHPPLPTPTYTPTYTPIHTSTHTVTLQAQISLSLCEDNAGEEMAWKCDLVQFRSMSSL